MNQRNKLIFFVDDDKMILNLLEYTFKNHDNYDVNCFLSGEECLDHLNLKPDLIVLDFYFSKQGVRRMNGLETLRKIRIQDHAVHVIMLSSQDDQQLVEELIRSGASSFISKDDYFVDSLKEAIEKELFL
jgi:two-component system, OmpR family, response regulator